tara:strand:- start:2088 stop:3356 length:1269 start_codon:yes stop_codon:yes gene_type:complete
MYWLIEEKDQIEFLLNSSYNEAFIEVIPYNDKVHPKLNNISLVYIRPISASKGYMLCINHSECLNALDTELNVLLNKFNVLYCRDKKEILHYFPLKTLRDVNLGPNPYIRPTTNAHNIMYYRDGDNPEINLCIPIVKHYEMCETIFWDLKDNINKKITKYDEFFNNRVSVVFNALERSGLRIHVPRFEGYFHPVDSEHVYTQYNLKTLTTRPSNKFKGVNYAALNKENGCRKAFIPSNDKLIELDISAYHPSLSCRLIDYNFPSVDIHDHLAKLYKVSYAKSKELTFKQLYGGVFQQYEHLEYFRKIKEYIRNMWTKFEKGEDIVCPVSSYVYNKELFKDMNPQKLFNYLLQNLETSMNVRILWDVLCLLRGKKTKLILYTYDSFLFDWDQKEQELMEDIKNIFKNYKFNIKIKQGYDYDFR